MRIEKVVANILVTVFLLAAFQAAGPFAVVPILFLIVGALEVSKSLTLRD